MREDAGVPDLQPACPVPAEPYSLETPEPRHAPAAGLSAASYACWTSVPLCPSVQDGLIPRSLTDRTCSEFPVVVSLGVTLSRRYTRTFVLGLHSPLVCSESEVHAPRASLSSLCIAFLLLSFSAFLSPAPALPGALPPPRVGQYSWEGVSRGGRYPAAARGGAGGLQGQPGVVKSHLGRAQGAAAGEQEAGGLEADGWVWLRIWAGKALSFPGRGPVHWRSGRVAVGGTGAGSRAGSSEVTFWVSQELVSVQSKAMSVEQEMRATDSRLVGLAWGKGAGTRQKHGGRGRMERGPQQERDPGQQRNRPPRQCWQLAWLPRSPASDRQLIPRLVWVAVEAPSRVPAQGRHLQGPAGQSSCRRWLILCSPHPKVGAHPILTPSKLPAQDPPSETPPGLPSLLQGLVIIIALGCRED